MFVYRMNQVEENRVAVKRGLSEKRLHDVYNKIVDLPGERGLGSEVARKNSRHVVALLRGTLGPQNVGYTLREEGIINKEGELWRGYWLEKPGIDKSLPAIVLITSYLPEPSSELANAADLSILCEVASVIAGQSPQRTIRVAFLPDMEMKGDYLKKAEAVYKIRSGSNADESYQGWDDLNEVSSFTQLKGHTELLYNQLMSDSVK